MSRPPKEGLAWAAAFAAVLPAVFFPVYNPDLFWHLSAGRWIVAHVSLPRADFLSSSLNGRPWLDFEWLSQLLYYAADASGGLWGVWAFKAGLVAAAVASFAALLRALEIGNTARAAARALFGVNLIAYADARPDLFSLILLSWLLRRLERKDLRVVEAFALFSVWSNLHGGFALGLVALVVYAAASFFGEEPALAKRRSLCLAAGALGACVNPYGTGAYAVVWRHWTEQEVLARTIKEWGPLAFSNPVYWPAWALLALLAAAALRRAFRDGSSPSWPLLGLAGYLAVATLQHERAALYFDLAGCAALAQLAPDDGRLQAGLLAACAAFLAWLLPRVSWTGAFNSKFVPVAAAEFFARERAAVEPLRVYNEWEWGGYLEFALPWFKASSDGRYLFHAQHEEEARAGEDAGAWSAHLRNKAYAAALVPNFDRRFPARRRYPDGTLKDFPRPWYLYYFPRGRWALVYWDAQALFFVDRSAVAPDWLSAHEYRWMRPRDDEAFADAFKRGEIPLEKVAAEGKRHLLEIGGR